MTCVKRIFKKITCFALMLLMGGGVFLSAFSLSASAAESTTSYSNVLDDLKRDQSFDPADYPARSDDYDLEVIHVAEGENGEVFLYVYQPSDATKDLRAAKVNMSLQDPTERDITYKLYNLTWLNSSGVFDKYLVNDLNVPVKDVRYYTITAIYTPYDPDIHDVANDDDDIKDFEGLPVGKSFAVQIYNGEYICESKNIEYVDVEIQSVGFTRYSEGFKLYSDSCDSHFVAFSIENFDVDWVYDADISYTYQKASKSEGLGLSGEVTYEEPIPVDSFRVVDASTGENDADGWFWNKKYTWNRITSLSTFTSEIKDQTNEFLTETDEANLSKADFVIRFLETDCTMYSSGYATTTFWTHVSEVAVLRLRFLSGNETYNLGVVSDIVSDDGLPDFVVDAIDNVQNLLEESWEIMLAILGIIVLIALLVALSFLGVKPIDIIKFVFRGLVFIVLAPIELIKRIFVRKNKKHIGRKRRYKK